jgi:hypothetical protein
MQYRTSERYPNLAKLVRVDELRPGPISKRIDASKVVRSIQLLTYPDIVIVLFDNGTAMPVTAASALSAGLI